MRKIPKKSILLITLALLAAPCAAGVRDPKADLVIVSTRFVITYTNTPHKAGDADGQFIEDVVIPAVNDVVTSKDGRLSNSQLKASIDFVIASEPLASEDISAIAATVYKSQKTQTCILLDNLPASKRAAVLYRIKSGIAAAGKSVPRVICP